MNGDSEKEDAAPIPQAQKQLIIQIDKVMEFSHAVHSEENRVQPVEG